MNLLLLISLIVIGVSSQIETNHGCKTGCECPDFSGSILDLDYTYSKMDGCTFKMSCSDGFRGSIVFAFDESEIERPSDAFNEYFTSQVGENPPFPSFDFMSTFGIVCEDGAWIATKYNFTRYLNTSGDRVVLPSETINGKKSRTGLVSCVV